MDGAEKQEPQTIQVLGRAITRRQAIKLGGIAVVGLAFSKPIIETIVPKPAFADYVTDKPKYKDDDKDPHDKKDDKDKKYDDFKKFWSWVNKLLKKW